MQGIFQKENTDKALKYGIYRHLPTYEKIIRNLVSFYHKNHDIFLLFSYDMSIIVLFYVMILILTSCFLFPKDLISDIISIQYLWKEKNVETY